MRRPLVNDTCSVRRLPIRFTVGTGGTNKKKQETGRNKKSRDSEIDTNGKQRTDTNRKLGNRYERADLIENWLGENLKWWI